MFTFSDTFYPPEPPSYASLTRIVELPNIFILCSSSKYARFDNRGSFSVLGEDGHDWLSFIMWQHPKAVITWLRWNKAWYKLGHLGNPRVNYWYHLCMEIDLLVNVITAAVNGEQMGRVVGKNIKNTPKVLRITLGKLESYDYSQGSTEKQFQGSVTNIHAIKVSTESVFNTTAMSLEPCSIEGDLLAWTPEDWKVEGTRWELVEEAEDSVCHQRSMYAVAFPFTIDIHQAMDICKKKLNNSIMPYQEDQASLEVYTSWYNNITGGLCTAVWTPFSDEEGEGTFINMNDGTLAKYLPWSDNQPNGETDENYVSVFLQTSLYWDNPLDKESCGHCFLHRSLLFHLDGLCEDSVIGDSSWVFYTFFQTLHFPWSTPSSEWATPAGETLSSGNKLRAM